MTPDEFCLKHGHSKANPNVCLSCGKIMNPANVPHTPKPDKKQKKGKRKK